MNKDEIKSYAVSLLRKIANHLENGEYEEIEKYLGNTPIGDGYASSYFINFDLGEEITVFNQKIPTSFNIHDIIERLKEDGSGKS